MYIVLIHGLIGIHGAQSIISLYILKLLSDIIVLLLFNNLLLLLLFLKKNLPPIFLHQFIVKAFSKKKKEKEPCNITKETVVLMNKIMQLVE